MLKVLHVVSYFPPDRMGGVGEVVGHVHRNLRNAGHSSTVLTTGQSESDTCVRRICRTPGMFALASAAHAELARDFDVVHMHHGEGLGLLAAMRLRRIRTPVLLTLHVSVDAMRRSLGPYRIGPQVFHRTTAAGWLHRHVGMRIRSWMDQAAIRLSNGVTFISRSAARDCLGAAGETGATVIYNGVAHTSPTPFGSSNRVELLYVGSNSERKRVELLPLILAEVRHSRPGTRLRIAGFSREENPELVGIASRLGVLEAIDFAGQITPGELPALYRSAQVLLVPSAYEGLPMVILEAMQEDLPVIATRVSGHPEVIEDGSNGLLVPLDDCAAMANAILRLLEDGGLRSRLAAAARNTVTNRFSVEQQVRLYISEYERLVRSRHIHPDA